MDKRAFAHDGQDDGVLKGLERTALQRDADDTEYLVAGANREVETARLGQGPRACARALVVGEGPGCNGALIVGEQRRGSVFGASGLIERPAERAVLGGVEDHVEF